MAKYQGTYSTPNTMGSVTMEVEAQSTFHAEELIKAQTGATEVYNIGYTTDSVNHNYSRNNEGYSSFGLGFIPTVILGGGALFLLSIFGGNVQQSEPIQTNNEKMEYVAPSNNVIQYSEHHIDESIPEFFNTELQEEAITDLGQDWDN